MSAKAGTSDIGTYIAAAGFFLVTPYGLGVIGGDGLRPVFIAVGVAEEESYQEGIRLPG